MGSEGALITRNEQTEVRRVNLTDPSAPSVKDSGSNDTGHTSKPSARKGRGKHFMAAGKPSEPIAPAHSPSVQQTNMDHWQRSKVVDHQDSLPRRACATEALQKFGHVLTEVAMWDLLFTYPIWDEQDTIYATVCSAHENSLSSVITCPLEIREHNKLLKPKPKRSLRLPAFLRRAVGRKGNRR
jgi:hypothetical protein